MTHGKIDGSETVMGVIDAARRLGTRRLADGTELVGRAPHVGPEAWLHVVFAPLAEPQLEDVEKQIERVLPADYASFLTRANGLALFSDALSLYGLRTSFRRTGNAVWQPYSITTPNVQERPRGADDLAVFIGGYDDGSLLYVEANGRGVHRCSRHSAKPLNSWKDFSTFLAQEARRLEALFDDAGRPLDPHGSTAPAPAVVG